MNDYISREAAISHPFANGQYDREHASKDFIMGHESYKEWLEAIPVADAVPVVRCKDCKHYKDGWCYNPNTYDDEKTRGNTSPEWYCADGERRTK